MAQLSLERIHKSYGPVEVVRGVDLQVDKGDIVCLLGGSGCGKTTTLRMVAGLETPTAGLVRIAGAVVSDERHHVPPEARQLGMVFQSYAVWPHLTVLENVVFPLRMQGVPAAEADRRAQQAIDGLRLHGLAERHPHQLSGGQQQRVALARALVAEPKLLLLDEPLSNLDAKLRSEVRDEIRALVKRVGLTAVLVTHDHEEAFAVADRIALMHAGRIQQDGPPTALYETPNADVVARFLGVEELPAIRQGDRVVVDGVTIDVHATSDAPSSGPCRLGFRAEAARLGETGIAGTVVSRTFLGHGWRCRVRVGEDEVRVTGDAAVGDAVRFTVARGFALGTAGR